MFVSYDYLLFYYLHAISLHSRFLQIKPELIIISVIYLSIYLYIYPTSQKYLTTLFFFILKGLFLMKQVKPNHFLNLFYYLQVFLSQLVGLVGREFANGWGDLGSTPGRVIPKTLKMVRETSLLNTQQYKVKWSSLGKLLQTSLYNWINVFNKCAYIHCILRCSVGAVCHRIVWSSILPGEFRPALQLSFF